MNKCWLFFVKVTLPTPGARPWNHLTIISTCWPLKSMIKKWEGNEIHVMLLTTSNGLLYNISNNLLRMHVWQWYTFSLCYCSSISFKPKVSIPENILFANCMQYRCVIQSALCNIYQPSTAFNISSFIINDIFLDFTSYPNHIMS